MFDRQLRPVKERFVAPLVAGPLGRLPPLVLTLSALAWSVGAAAAAWRELAVLAAGAWLVGRLLDGVDGAVARRGGRQSDLGGYLDLLLDSVAYALIPLGIALGADDDTTWIVVAVLLATFYVNVVSLLLLSALLEKRAAGVRRTAESTSVTMPTGLVEGAETIVLFTVALAVPVAADAVFVAMSLAVMIGVVQRIVAARHLLA